VKAKPFKGASVPNLAGKGPHDTIARDELVALIAEYVPRESADDESTVRNRISSRVTYAVKVGQLSPEFLLGEGLEWIHKTWPGCLDQLPVFPKQVSEDLVSTAHATASVHDLIVPGDLTRCQTLIGAMDSEICELKKELAGLRESVALLAPKAAKWDNWIAKKGR